MVGVSVVNEIETLSWSWTVVSGCQSKKLTMVGWLSVWDFSDGTQSLTLLLLRSLSDWHSQQAPSKLHHSQLFWLFAALEIAVSQGLAKLDFCISHSRHFSLTPVRLLVCDSWTFPIVMKVVVQALDLWLSGFIVEVEQLFAKEVEADETGKLAFRHFPAMLTCSWKRKSWRPADRNFWRTEPSPLPTSWLGVSSTAACVQGPMQVHRAWISYIVYPDNMDYNI